MQSRELKLRRPIIGGVLFTAVLSLCVVSTAHAPTSHISSSPTVPIRLLYVIRGFPKFPLEYVDLNGQIEKEEIGNALGDKSRVTFRKKEPGEATCNPNESCDGISLSYVESDNHQAPCSDVPGTGKRCYFRYLLVVDCSLNDAPPAIAIESSNPDPERRAKFLAERVATQIKIHDDKKHPVK